MITPVRNISFKYIKNKNLKTNKDLPSNPPLDNYKENSIYFGNSKISFGGYLSMKPKMTLEYGIENNFFALPEVTLEDGTKKQIQPDKSQKDCASKLCQGKNVAFFAPTGMGKTSVAHFAINKNLFEGKKTIYTVPIKALANDKYTEFSKIYGQNNVGILTGDRKIKPNAPIVIMTTEIFNNQAQGMSLNEAMQIGTVVYDEAHYIADEERGIAWENSMINAASKGVQILALTATAGNSQDFCSWIGKIKGSRPSEIVEVSSKNRPVPLVWHLYRPSNDYGNKFVQIVSGQVDLSSDLEDKSDEIINVIYRLKQESLERQQRDERYGKNAYEGEFVEDRSDKQKIRYQLEELLGLNWASADFLDNEVQNKMLKEFNFLTRIDLEQIDAFSAQSGVRNLSDNQKRALEVLFKNEYEQNPNYEMSDDDYNFIYQQLKMGIGEGNNNFKFDSETFKKRLRKEFRSLNETQLDLISQLMTKPDSKSTKEIHEVTLTPDYPSFIRDLKNEDMLPAIIFKLTQGGCEEVAGLLAGEKQEDDLSEDDLKKLEEDSAKLDLLTPKEKQEVQKIIEKYEQNGVYLGTSPQKQMLLRGWGVHHAGKVPQYKKLVEELFSKKLLKVVISTSTLGAGINMPARTVVMTNAAYAKYNDETKEYEQIPLTSNEFHQMTGRAGRRGIDDVGHVVLYSLPTAPKGFRKDYEKDKNGNYDELWVAYDLIKKPADNLRSTFRPQSAMLANYYSKDSDIEDILPIIRQTFKLYLAKDKEKAEKQMFKKFENYTQVLQKLGCVEKRGKTKYYLTPKGEILSQAQGMNPLLLTSLLYDEKLAKMNPVNLAQVVGYIQGTSKEKESDESSIFTDDVTKNMLNALDGEFSEIQFYSTKQTLVSTQDKILKALNEGRVNKEDIKTIDSFSGNAVGLFALLNEQNPDDSIGNFEKIVASGNCAYSQNAKELKEYQRKTREGNVYKLITGSISTLKQIIRICDYALYEPDKFPNTSYWQFVKENAQSAIELLDKEPINNDPNYENKLSNN